MMISRAIQEGQENEEKRECERKKNDRDLFMNRILLRARPNDLEVKTQKEGRYMPPLVLCRNVNTTEPRSASVVLPYF